MINDTKTSCLAIIPARGGSKGIKHKNLRLINGKSLVARAVEICRKSGVFTDILVSTDCPKIANEAKKYGASVPFLRPDEISGDLIGDIDVLIHGLVNYEKFSRKKYDYLAMIQPTSPMRKIEDLQLGYETIKHDKYDAVWSVTVADKKYHPLKLLKMDQNYNLELYDERGNEVIARQQLEDFYVRNGNFYFFCCDHIKHKKSIYAKKFKAIVQENFQISIDIMSDLKAARTHFRKENDGI
jgi:CMP-N,N'-diacetyllegionaminic acid synthase